jgi:hypothetical protein
MKIRMHQVLPGSCADGGTSQSNCRLLWAKSPPPRGSDNWRGTIADRSCQIERDWQGNEIITMKATRW